MGEQPTFAEQMKLYRNLQVKSKKELEESQLPFKLKGCNEGQGFRGNCDSQGKLGMCPSLAEPDSSGFPRNGFHNVSRETLHILAANTKPQATKKFFDPAIFQKCWRGVGE